MIDFFVRAAGFFAGAVAAGDVDAGALAGAAFFAAVAADRAVPDFAAAGLAAADLAGAAFAVADFAAPDLVAADWVAVDFGAPDFARAAGFSAGLRLREVLLEVTMSVSFQKFTSGQNLLPPPLSFLLCFILNEIFAACHARRAFTGIARRARRRAGLPAA